MEFIRANGILSGNVRKKYFAIIFSWLGTYVFVVRESL